MALLSDCLNCLNLADEGDLQSKQLLNPTLTMKLVIVRTPTTGASLVLRLMRLKH